MNPVNAVPINSSGKRAFISHAWSVILFVVALALASPPLLAQVQLKSRTIQPSMETTAEFVKALKAAPGNAQHGLATFSTNPTDEERKAFEALGIRVLAPFQGTTYRVRVEKRLNTHALKSSKLKIKLIRLNAEDRVDPILWREDLAAYMVTPPDGKPRNYVLNADGTLNLTVRIHAGVAEAESMGVLRKHAQSFAKQSDEAWVAIVPRASLRALAGEDIVQWIDAGPPPFLPENDAARAAINADAVQKFNVMTGQVQGLGGNGVQVGIFDFGVDETHGDFSGRVIRNDAGMDAHATHLAGTIAGNGTMSDKVDSRGANNNGSPFQWRGMAPLAQLIDIDQMPPFGTNGAKAATHLDYITNQGMDLSNHSYVFSLDGSYDNSNQTRDQIIRGDATADGKRVPGRLHVTSAGNNGQTRAYGNQVGYFALTKQVKNGLVVGNWDAGANRIDQTSSLGPAHDGRIKPDVVAPGASVKSTGYCANSGANAPAACMNAAGQTVQTQNFYRAMRGTSMASAVTTGAVALLLEQYATTYAVNLDQHPPLPSTLRAVMIHTARDIQAGTAWFSNPDGAVQPTPGPDFVTGWGLIDAQAAVNTVANRLLLEDIVTSTCDAITYLFNVPPGTAGPVRVTLAWDDVAGNPALANTDPKLVNDLDLVLIDPNGTQHFPWQLDQNIVDAAGNPITDALQQCGTAITVQRKFTPVSNPASNNDTIPAGGVPVAVPGRDHLNNVEVAEAPVVAGTWQAKVTGFNIPQGPQGFSLIGNSFTRLTTRPVSVCSSHPQLCYKRVLFNLCQRFPKICDNWLVFPRKDRVLVKFVDLRQKLPLPLDKICHYAINCPACGSGALCTGYDLQVGNMSIPLRAEIYSSRGRLVKRDVSDKPTKRLRFDARHGEEYFIVLSPGNGTKLDTEYEISLSVKQPIIKAPGG